MKTNPAKLLIFLLILLFGSALGSFAQEASIEQTYTDFYKYPREKMVVQLNKTVFMPGESIWFQAYLIEPKTGKTSNISSNIYAGIFDADGKLIKHKLLFAEDGIAGGSFSIDNTFTGHEYTLKMFTRWMLNFDENLDFNQRFFVINDDLYPNPKVENYIPPFEVNIYTEGDSGFLENTLNNLVFTLTDATGKRVDIQSGQVLDETRNVISEINKTAVGMGRAAFFIEPGKKYTLQLTAYNGITAEKDITQVKKQGLMMKINNLDTAKLTLGVYNNFPVNTTLDSLSFELVIEKDGYIYSRPLRLEAGKNTVINLDKSVLTTGIYRAYLIKDGKILVERPFFNKAGNSLLKPDIKLLKSYGDSLQLQLATNVAEPFVFSVSMLPENTGAMLDRHSLPEQLYGRLDDAGPTETDDRTLLAAIDLNLIQEGKSGGNWNERFGTAKPLGYNFEKGISFRGKIKLKNGKPPKDKIMVFSESMSFQQTLEPYKDGNFESHHNYLENGTVLKVALIDSKKKLKKPELDFFEVFPDVEEVLTAHTAQKIDEQAQTILNDYKSEASSFPLIEGEKKVTALNEVEVSAVKKEKILEHKPAMYSEVDTKGYKITNDEIKQFQYVTDYLRTKGYNVSLSSDLIPVDIGRPSISLSSSGSNSNQSSGDQANASQSTQVNSGSSSVTIGNGGVSITSKRPPFTPPTIYLDGAKLFDFSLINRMQMNIVDEVYIDYGGLSSGIIAGGGQGGIIYIITRNDIGGYSVGYNPETQATVTVKNGFSPPENYQPPNYTDLENPVFQKYGALDWKAFLTTDNTGKLVFTLDNKGMKRVRLFIEGVSTNGRIISWEQEIQIQ